MNALKALHDQQDQAVWLDFVARGFIEKGELKTLVEEDGLRGVTSNPAIFEKAIGHSAEYDDSLKAALAGGDARVIDLYEGLAIADSPVECQEYRSNGIGQAGICNDHVVDRLRCRRHFLPYTQALQHP